MLPQILHDHLQVLCVHSNVMTVHCVHDMQYTYCQSGIPPGGRTVRIMFTSLVERERTNATHSHCFKEWEVAYAVSICPSLQWRTDITSLWTWIMRHVHGHVEKLWHRFRFCHNLERGGGCVTAILCNGRNSFLPASDALVDRDVRHDFGI